MKNEILNQDCFEYLQQQFWVDTIFADPPDGIKLNYIGFNDTIDDYYEYMSKLLKLCRNRCYYLWLSFNPIRVINVAQAAPRSWKVKPCVQTFTFGQHNQNDLGTGHRYLWRFGAGNLYPDSIRIPSWRQKNGDKRADPRGAVPLDVFDFPRVTGNSGQRRRWHPTQLHEGLVERCLKLTTPSNGKVLDLFAGTGTVHRVCKRLKFRSTSLEISPYYYQKLLEEDKVDL
jgi:DNA modification methylase